MDNDNTGTSYDSWAFWRGQKEKYKEEKMSCSKMKAEWGI